MEVEMKKIAVSRIFNDMTADFNPPLNGVGKQSDGNTQMISLNYFDTSNS